MEQKMGILTAPVCRLAGPLVAIGLAGLLSGCSTIHSDQIGMEVTVRPGSTTICVSDPCTVYFETPAGSGTHNILQAGSLKAGLATGGQRVLLGEYSNQSVVFHVEGTKLPVAYLTVIGGP
jgi:hypothetical protein